MVTAALSADPQANMTGDGTFTGQSGRFKVDFNINVGVDSRPDR